MVGSLLTELSLDLQIHICEFLHPLDILALRQTCKAFHHATSQQIVWIHALNRVCYHHSVFRPTFPIPDMSVSELERAATAPSRWIALSSSKDRNTDEILPSRQSRTTPIIGKLIPLTENDSQDLEGLKWKIQDVKNVYLVPGGRYLVAAGRYVMASGYGYEYNCLVGVWDLGYVSDGDMSSDGKSTRVWTTRVDKIDRFIVHPTPDGLGIRILTCSSDNVLCVFEIYPQKTTHEHAKIGELTLNFPLYVEFFFCGNRAVIHGPSNGVVIVWDFMANTVASWSVNMPRDIGFFDQNTIIGVTETTIGISHHTNSGPIIGIFKIPLLITKTPLLDKLEDLPKVAPFLEFKDPTIIAAHSQRADSWYFGHGALNSSPFYLDVCGRGTGNVIGRCTVDITSDLHYLSLSLIPNALSTTRLLKKSTPRYYYAMPSYRICEDSFVHVVSLDGRGAAAITVGFGLSSDRHDSSETATTQVNDTRLVKAEVYLPYSFCPSSGRFIYVDRGISTDGFIISDFL